MSDVCPLGYEPKKGDISGWGSEDLGSGLMLTRDECARKCSEKDGCLSFEHSYAEGKCNLNDVSEPNQGPYKDYVFCTKLGNILEWLNDDLCYI